MQPPVTAAAMRYFCAVYERRMMMEPQIMTGIILAHLPSVWTGKLTYLSASYWHVVATTLENDTRQYSCIFATCVGGVGGSQPLSLLTSLALALSLSHSALSELSENPVASVGILHPSARNSAIVVAACHREP